MEMNGTCYCGAIEWQLDGDPGSITACNCTASNCTVCQWIVSLGHQPFAYMQDYAVHGWGSHPFDHLHIRSRGIDQFIGLPDLMGNRHGPAFIRQRMQALFDQGVPVVATDPHSPCLSITRYVLHPT